ncbi:zinc finger protein 507 [Aplochiton taeniatus]
MEENSSPAVLALHSSSASVFSQETSSRTPAPSSAPAPDPVSAAGAGVADVGPKIQQSQASDSLVQVIEKLSRIVDRRPQRRCTLAGHKRALQAGSAPAIKGRGGGGGVEKEEETEKRELAPRCKRARESEEEEAKGEAGQRSDSLPGSDPPAATVTEEGGDVNNNRRGDGGGAAAELPVAMSYQCSLCHFLSPSLAQLRQHLGEHDKQHSDLLLMCSECRYTSRHQGELEAHVRLHLHPEEEPAKRSEDAPSSVLGYQSEGKEEEEEEVVVEEEEGARVAAEAEHGVVGNEVAEVFQTSVDCAEETPEKKKWYSYEDYGMYRCLICSYVCGQQRMLKTHAWKHAGLVDCSYPIFEDEAGAHPKREPQALLGLSGGPQAKANAGVAPREEEALVVLSPLLPDKPLHKISSAFQLQLRTPLAPESPGDPPAKAIAAGGPKEQPEPADGEAYAARHPAMEEPMVEVQVTTEAEPEGRAATPDGRRGDGAVTADSLLSSAQKIISCSPNGAGHVNVIVERLPSAEGSVTAADKPLLLGPDLPADRSLLGEEEEEAGETEMNHQRLDVGPFKPKPEELAIGWSDSGGVERQLVTPPPDPVGSPSNPAIGSAPPRDENVPPAGRRRTHSESLRLHSLAAEALVAMPMRTPQLLSNTPGSTCSTRAGLRSSTAQALSPDAGHRGQDGALRAGREAEGLGVGQAGSAAAMVGLELQGGQGREDGLESLEQCLGLGLADGEEGCPTSASKAGISLSLLTVIERLRERSDQNTSDEDILRELQDNAQTAPPPAAAAVVVEETGGVAAPAVAGVTPCGGLVDYVPGAERPYRCRLCRYSSGNKGYIKQHLRVHRQREPYQCPICEHVAADSKELERHMIHHCKSRMHQCPRCPDTFHYKSQLRSHERDHHSSPDAMVTLAPVSETTATAEDSETRIASDADERVSKVFKCDVCEYTSSTYVGVRNHRRIHNSDKPYRCCSCDFATTNMNSLKSHMRRHPQEHQTVQLLEQYRCSLCGYVCSHPPSLKSHMWKHAGDQNYNYEQVNQAINEAISQSSRTPSAPQKLSSVLDPASVTERPVPAQSARDHRDPRASPDPALTGSPSPDGPAPSSTEPAHWAPRDQPADTPSPPAAKEGPQSQHQHQHQHLQLQAQPRLSPAAPGSLQGPGPGPKASMEYCVLLFCCCICGFEYTSKERLMEHMKEHEGDIISIILNKEQPPQQQQQQQQQHCSLQAAEGGAAQ